MKFFKIVHFAIWGLVAIGFASPLLRSFFLTSPDEVQTYSYSQSRASEEFLTDNIFSLFDLKKTKSIPSPRPMDFAKMKPFQVSLQKPLSTRQFTIYARVLPKIEDGDLLSFGDCNSERLLIHMPHAAQVYFQIGEPSVNFLKLALHKMQFEKPIDLFIIKNSTNEIRLIVDNQAIEKKLEDFENNYTKFMVGNSLCNHPFKGQIFSLILFDRVLKEEEIAKLRFLSTD